jgi:glycosyltransferase involved in cell wall biosynthesis
MNICLAVKYIANRQGGAERNIVELANYLSCQGHQVSISTYDESDGKPAFPLSSSVKIVNARKRNEFRYPATAKELAEESARVAQYSESEAMQWYSDSFSMRTYWSRAIIASCPDVLISYMPHTSTPLLEQFGDSTSFPIIVTNQNSPHVDYFSDKHGENEFERKKRFNNLKFATRITVLLDEYLHYFPEELRERLRVIPNVVYPPPFDLNSIKEKKEIVGLGRLAPQKGFDILIRAMRSVIADHPDWRLMIYGRGEEEDRLRELIRSSWLQRSVLLRGKTNKPLAAMASAPIFIIPSFYEGFPLSLGEAMSIGRACVGFTDCSGVNSIIHNNKNGILLEERSETALADVIKILIENVEKRAIIGRNAKEYVRKFKPEKVYPMWDALIEEARREKYIV